MLRRLYIDNYKCFVNFEFTLGNKHILLGRNGTGKSTLFEIIDRLRRFVADEGRVTDLFPAETLTRWQERPVQTFEIDLEVERGLYRYRLQIHHDPEKGPAKQHEHLSQNGRTLFESDRPRSSSGLSFYEAEGRPSGEEAVVRFIARMNRVILARINPQGIGSRSEQEVPRPAPDMSNFASWYRHLIQEQPRAVEQVQKALREALDGFVGMRLSREGKNTRELRVEWALAELGERTMELDFAELSDGQRALVVLYSLIRAFPEEGATLCLDEPDNFVALSELQPWLGYLEDQVVAGKIQALVISHHPELINDLALESGVLLLRDGSGPVRVRPFELPPDMPLTAAEVVARGWEDEQA